MLKFTLKIYVLFSLLISANVLAQDAPVKSNYDIGKNIGNMVGVAYGAKLMYQEVRPHCIKLSKKSGFDEA